MPRRTRRTDDETSVAEDGATSISPSSPILNSDSTNDDNSNTQSVDAIASDTAKAPKVSRPRTRRPAAAKASVEPSAESSETVEASVDPNSASEAAPRRRPGGRRKTASDPTAEASVEVSEDSTDTSSASTDDAETSRSRRSRRGGRRRRGGREDAVLIASDSDDQATPDQFIPGLDTAAGADETEATAEGDASTRGKSRRPGRGGRRTKGERPASSDTVEVELAELSLPAPNIREPWIAPSLVPSISELHLEPFDPGITAVLQPRNGFVINGELSTPYLFFVNADSQNDNHEIVANQIKRAAKAGIHLHTCVVYLPLKNAHGERNFAPVDHAVETIIAADPDAKIILRIQCVPTNFWVRTHPNQMVKYHDGSEGDVSVVSIEFWEDCVLAVDALLRRLTLEATPGHGRVFAVHLDKGEWFHEPGAGYDYSLPSKLAFRNWLHNRYQTLYALRAAWFDGKVTFDTADIPQPESTFAAPEECVLFDQPKDRRHIDYLTFASAQVGEVLCSLAAAVKELTQGKLLVFAPYGYLFEFASRNGSGHQALGTLLQCPHIDVLTGPNSYTGRSAGSVGGFASPVDSVSLHGKLWIVEDDTKTYMAPDDTPDTYNPHIAGQQETVMVHRRNLYSAAAHGCGIAWMDLWGQGWLDSDSIWEEITVCLNQCKQLRASSDFDEKPEVAVIVDENSYAWVRSGPSGQRLQANLIPKARDLMTRSGAQIRYYLQSDVALLPESIKVVFFLNALRVSSDERISIRERLQKDNRILVWVYSPGLFDENGPTPAEVSEIVGMPLKSRAWNAKVGTIFTDDRHPVIERLHGGKRMGTEDCINPSFTTIDSQTTVLGEYAATGEPSVVLKTVDTTWRSIFVGELHLTGELIRGILRWAGVHLYDVQDDIVSSRGDGLLMIHAPYTGQRVIHLPEPKACYCVTENRLLAASSSSIRHFMRGRSTQLFVWGGLDQLAERLGKTVAELEASLQTRHGSDNQRGRDSQDDRQNFDSEESGSEYRAEEDSDPAQSIENTDSSSQSLPEDADARAKHEAALVTKAVLAETPVLQDEQLPIDSALLDDKDGDNQSESQRRHRRRGQNNEKPTPPPTRNTIADILGGLLGRRNKPR